MSAMEHASVSFCARVHRATAAGLEMSSVIDHHHHHHALKGRFAFSRSVAYLLYGGEGA